MVFDGTNDAVTFPTISVSGAWSIGMWINSTTTANWKTLISNAGGGRDVVRVRQGNGRVGVSRLGVADAEHGTYTLPTNQWVYLVIVRSGTNVHFYVSGTLRATIANRGFDLSMVVLGASGESASDTSSFGEFFSGSIDDLVVFDKALNTTQIGNLETVAANTVAYAVPEPTNEAPGVIPRLRSWTGGMGSFTLSSSTKLTYSTTDGALSKNSQTQPGLSAQTLAEVATLFTTEILSQESITVTTEAASSLAAGNIHFVLDSTLADVGAEGYTMDIDSDRILITARTSTGAFYATRTLLQFLKISGDQTILVGDVKDYPSYQTRQIMLDAGRKYWTMDFIKDFIRDMSYLKMNSIFMKFMDVDGFRLHSTKAAFKGLANDEVGYNRAEIRELMAFSKKYHVDIMPGFAFPTHAYPVSRHFTIGLRGHCPNPGDPAGWDYVMDMTDPQALTVANQILREFVPWFTGPYVHTGGDELPGHVGGCAHITGYVSRTAAIGHWKDLLFRMTNQMNTTVKALNKTLVIFNGFEHARSGAQRLNMDTDIAISVWEQSSPISSLSAHKQIIVGTAGELFLTPNEWHALYSNPATIYSSWAPSGASNVLGAGMSVWPDFIKAGDDQYFEDFMLPRRGPMAARLWNRTIPSDTYATISRPIMQK